VPVLRRGLQERPTGSGLGDVVERCAEEAVRRRRGAQGIKHIGETRLAEQVDSFDEGDIELELLVGRPAEPSFGLAKMIEQDEELFLGDGFTKS